MPEIINPNASPALTTVNLNIPSNVNYWMSKWGVTFEQLKKAVDYVGGKEARVADYLRSKGIIRF
ncbi:MAG: DUF3606 domain-containing protein [Saprospiraceae bacterium]